MSLDYDRNPESRDSEPANDSYAAAGNIEKRSIDYIPLAERHGKPWHLGALWFTGTATIGSVAIGLIGIASGANLFWTLVAIVLGSMFGTVFSAFHSSQGPQLGLPQMVQSRPQFGYKGSLLVWVFILISYIGYNAFGASLGGDTLASVAGGDGKMWAPAVTLASLALAILGYDWIHRLSRWVSVLFLIVYGFFSIAAVLSLDLPGNALDPGEFQLLPFMIQFAVSAGYLISWAPYVSDYSRYLPPSVGVRSVFLWTYLGMSLSSIWLLGLGALIAQAYPTLGVIEAVRTAGDSIFAGFGSVVILAALPGLVVVIALNLYGGSLTLLTIVDTFKPLKPTVLARVASITVVMLLGMALVYLFQEDFLTSFGTFLVFLLYLFGPWTAINLVDFYFVRRGHYSITEIFNPNGMYGVWNWRGLSAYGIGFLSTIPFQSTLFYTGPVAAAIGGVDFAPFVGILVAGITYKILARSLDLAAQSRRIEELDAGLDNGLAARASDS